MMESACKYRGGFARTSSHLLLRGLVPNQQCTGSWGPLCYGTNTLHYDILTITPAMTAFPKRSHFEMVGARVSTSRFEGKHIEPILLSISYKFRKIECRRLKTSRPVCPIEHHL